MSKQASKQEDLFPCVQGKKLFKKDLEAKYNIHIFFVSQWNSNVEHSFTSYGFTDNQNQKKYNGPFFNLKSVETEIIKIRNLNHETHETHEKRTEK